MVDNKRKDLLLDAFARIAGDHDDSYLFIGGGPENEVFASLRERIESDAALRGRAFVTGFIPEEQIGPIFSAADIYASASEMEGFGMSVSQAAAAETAVISSDLIPFSVQYVPEAAIIVPAGSVDGFASAMDRLLGDDADRRNRAARLIEKVRTLNWEALTAAFLDHLRADGMTIAEGKVTT
jgi:glycosyltransferase involved in cell wall biosynthesis